MAKSARAHVFEGMEELPAALAPFVEKRLETSLPGHWQVEVAERLRLKPNGDGAVGWDQQGLLKAMMSYWNEAFKSVLGHAERSYVSELLDVRNKLSHNEDFTYDDAERALDTMRPLGSGGQRQRRGRGDRPAARGDPAREIHRDAAQRGEEDPAARHRRRDGGRPETLARGGRAAPRRGDGRLHAGRVRRRSRHGRRRAWTGGICRPGRVLRPHLPHRGPLRPPDRRGQAPVRCGRRPGGRAADQFRRRQDPFHAGALPHGRPHAAPRPAGPRRPARRCRAGPARPRLPRRAGRHQAGPAGRAEGGRPHHPHHLGRDGLAAGAARQASRWSPRRTRRASRRGRPCSAASSPRTRRA